MDNATIAKTLNDIAELLELKGDSPFKVRAYQRAAHIIDSLNIPIERLVVDDRLREVPGVGESIAQKIRELVETDRLAYYDELRRQFPEGVTALMHIPGIGPKTAFKLASALGIKSVDELEQAIGEGSVAKLPRMGEKLVENIHRQLAVARTKERRIPLGVALPIVEEIIAGLQRLPGLRNITPAGSLRRFAETIGDIDLMGTADDPPSVLRTFCDLPLVRMVLSCGTTKASVIVAGSLQVDLRLVDHESFGSLLQYFTGSKDHNVQLRTRALKRGLSLSEYGITNVKTGVLEKFAWEEDFYARLGMQYIPPEMREALGEIELAEQASLPTLMDVKDIKGDLHVHTEESDGNASLAEMVQQAQAMGYEYIALTEHSSGRGVARGLTEERLRAYVAQIAELQRQHPTIRLLTGTEVDIRADGTLDYADDLLAELDVVVASVHSSMHQDKERMTARVLRALRNPHVDVLGHPTGRLIGQREPIALDLEAVFREAARTGTALEINAMPDRLDLRDVHVSRARELGVRFVIATDAHPPGQMELMRLGVSVARRAWCGPEHILNTRRVEELVHAIGRAA
jgi:DNA polymerase (family 10)